MKPPRDSGVVLLQVLVIIAIASAAVMLMVNADQLAVQRSLRLRQAAQATAAATGGELSAVVALRRDAVETPDTDNLTEAWAKLGEQDAAIEGGAFSLTVEDAQSRFNLNNLLFDAGRSDQTFQRVIEAAEVPPAMGLLIANTVRQTGPLGDLSAMGAAGVDAQTLSRLASFATALPAKTEVNLNTAGEPLIGALLADRVLAALLVARRTRAGFVGPDDIRELGAALPSGSGFTSNFYRVATRVRIGDTQQNLHTLLARQFRNGGVEVIAISRRR